jgi:hypothetical protein
MGFLGMRFRLGYTAYSVQGGSKALGGLDQSNRTYLLYQGSEVGDSTGAEASWQQRQWSTSKRQIFVPSGAPDTNPKEELLRLLDEPSPTPLSMLYIYCQCSVGDGDNPQLVFAETPKKIVVTQTELGFKELADKPFVFANACTTASGGAYMANELERGFFSRGCRAFLGTETKVPIQLASRFASVFFHFFYREADPAPMAAGEAVAQSRLFLWSRYRNIGGLFYTYVNQYELFMAEGEEVIEMRA